MIHTYRLNGLKLQTGDIICTTNGTKNSFLGRFWHYVGFTIPGSVDHVAIYTGPGGRCVEAAANGVVTFEIADHRWDAQKMFEQRRLLDQLVGVAYPLANRPFRRKTIEQIRIGVAHYCLSQAISGKPYNPFFFAPNLDSSFYCSQLIYKAYLAYGINLGDGPDITVVPNDAFVMLPQAIWQNVPKRKAVKR